MARLVKNNLLLIPKFIAGNAIPMSSLLDYNNNPPTLKFLRAEPKNKMFLVLDHDLKSFMNFKRSPDDYAVSFGPDEKVEVDLWKAKESAGPNHSILHLDVDSKELLSITDKNGLDILDLKFDIPLNGAFLPASNLHDYYGSYALVYFQNDNLHSISSEFNGGSVKLYPSEYAASLAKDRYISSNLDMDRIVAFELSSDSMISYGSLFTK